MEYQNFWHLTLNDILMLLVVLTSPFLAVFVQRKIDLSREKRGHKLWIFRTLMATRGNKLSLEHVQALNSIELFFDDPKKDKIITEKWNEYFDHINQAPKDTDRDYLAKLPIWSEKMDDLLAEVLKVMGDSLGYDFDKVKIKRGIYVPRGHGDEQNDHYLIRKGMVSLLTNKFSLPVKVDNNAE